MINVVGAAGAAGDRKGSGYDVFVPTPVTKVAEEKTEAAATPVMTATPTVAPQPVGSVVPATVVTVAVPAATPAPTPEPEIVPPTPSTPPPAPATPPGPTKPEPKAIDPKRKRLNMILAGIFLLLLLIGGGVAFYLSRINQDVRQQASGGAYSCSGSSCCDTANESCMRTCCCPNGQVYKCGENYYCHPCSNTNPTTPAATTAPSPTATVAPSPTVTVAPSITVALSPTVEATPVITGQPSPTEVLLSPSPTAEAAVTPTVVVTTEPTTIPSGDPTVASTPTTMAAAPTDIPPTITPAPTTSDGQRIVETTAACNESCTVNANCSNPSHVCYNGACRLDTNPDDTACRLPSGNTQTVITEDQYQRQVVVQSQPSSGDTLPVTGPEDWLKYLKIGLGILGVGSLLLLLL